MSAPPNRAAAPPRLGAWLLRRGRSRIGRPLAEVEGDLGELYSRRIAMAGPRNARVRYLRDVISLVVLKRRRRSGGSPFRTGGGGGVGGDLRYALRGLRRSPGYCAVVVATLALGIGANSAVFALVDDLLLSPMDGIPSADGIVHMFTAEGGDSGGVSAYADFVDIRDRSRSFAALAAFRSLPMDLSGRDATERVSGLIVSSEYFEALGVRPEIGRFFLPEEDRVPDSAPVAVIGYGLWRSSFASDPAVLGESILLNGREFTIVGVAPAGFAGTTLIDRPVVFAPSMMQGHFMPGFGYGLDRRGWGGFLVVGRLVPGVAPDAAAAEIRAIGEQLEEEFPQTNAGREYTLEPLATSSLPPFIRDSVVSFGALLMAMVAIVLLVCCVNVANLMLARGVTRVGELAIRQSLGAARFRVIRQLMLENLLLAGAGGALGLGLAVSASGAMANLPLAGLDVRVDWRVIAFTLAVAVIAGLVAGLVPAVRSSRLDLSAVLKADAGATTTSGQRLVSGLVVGQVAASVILVVCATLFGRTLANLLTSDPGMNVEDVLVVEADPRLQGYSSADVIGFYDTVVDRAGSLPGVAATLTSELPSADLGADSIHIEGFPGDDGRAAVRWPSALVSASYFQTLDIPLLRGRGFTSADGPGGQLVALVSESGARAIEGVTGQDALGSRLSLAGPEGPWISVVGVVGDTRIAGMRAEGVPILYGSFAQVAPMMRPTTMVVLARADGDAAALAGTLREIAREADSRIPVVAVRPLEAYLFADSLAQERLAVLVLGAASALALAMAAIGLYGVLAYSVRRRMNEMGIRRALGAGSSDLRRMVVRRGLTLTLVGILTGTVAVGALERLLAGFLYGTPPLDPLTYGFATLLLVVVASGASLLPARRATSADPVVALRHRA